jgi:hypothetical protein
MSAIVIKLALLAAILHATWDAFLRSGDRFWAATVMSDHCHSTLGGGVAISPPGRATNLKEICS